MNTKTTYVLLDEYLAAIGLLLPLAEKNDILNELRANLEAELEDRAAAKGEPLSEDDVCEVLRNHGEPGEVASRFQPQRYLIGPALWPYFWLGVKVLAIVAAVIAGMKTLSHVLSVGHGWIWATLPVQFPLTFLSVAFPLFSVWVIVSALAERGRASAEGDPGWDPRMLKKDGAGSVLGLWAKKVARGARAFSAETFTSSKAENLANDVKDTTRAFHARDALRKGEPKHPVLAVFGEAFGALVAIIFWFCLFHFTHLFMGNVESNLRPAPVWEASYHFVLGLLVVKLALAFVPLVNVRSVALRQAVKGVDAVLGLFTLQPFLAAPALVVAGPVAEGVRDLTVIAENINRWHYPVLLVIVLITAVQALVHAGKALIALFGERE